MRMKSIIPFLAVLLWSARAWAWAHQGHIIMTDLAALRIIDDPSAPAGLRDFLQENLPRSREGVKDLATGQTVGLHPDQSGFNQGLEKWCVMPDLVRLGPDARTKIAPYGMSESYMHFLDLEAFSPQFAYKDDLSSKPDVDKIPHDLGDPRWKRGGFVPFRVEETYRKLAGDFGPGDAVAKPQSAPEAAGYLAHYIEDSTQPHHATMDFESASYLIGHVPGLPATSRPESSILAAMRLPHGIDPHGDLEFQLFENNRSPRSEYRQEYWKYLLADIDAQAALRSNLKAGTFDPFRWDLRILSDSYDALPLVGRAAQAAYADGSFNASAFFEFQGHYRGDQMNIVQLIALQNAKAVLDVQQALRLAWASSHS